MALVLTLRPHKYKELLGCLFVLQSSQFFNVTLDGVLLDSDWLLTTLRENQQQYI